jgi:predicted TIM-barrel fold metal-dependent hydrolase
MIIDFSTHIYPAGYMARLSELPNAPWGSFHSSPMYLMSEANPATKDLDVRRRAIDRYAAYGYRQVLSLVQPPIEEFATPAEAAELATAVNEELRELVDAHPDCFVSALGTLPLNDPDAAHREIDRLVELGLAGIELPTHVNGRPLDHPEILPVLEDLLGRGLVIFLHPWRTPRTPDYPTETESKMVAWQIFGWPYDTTVAMVRLAASGLFERLPEAVIVTHHLGAMVPYFAARADIHYEAYGFSNPLASDVSDEVELTRPMIEQLRCFHGDTALNGGSAGITCGLDFFGTERVLFGSDMPMDRAGGFAYIPLTIEAVEKSGASPQAKEAIYEGNARRVLKLDPAPVVASPV